MAKKKINWGRIITISLLVIIILLLMRGCEGGCDRFGDDNTSTETTTTTIYSFPTTTTTLEEITCGESLQGICEGSCPVGQSCQMINTLFSETCKCIADEQR